MSDDASAPEIRLRPEPGDAEAFMRAALNRRAMRHFAPDPLPEGALERLLAIAQRAPTGYNLQPWIAIVVTDPERKRALRKAAFGQAQVEEAPATVVFAADTDPIRHLPRAVELGVSTGHWSAEYARYIPPLVRLVFLQGPLRLLQPIKWALFRPLSLIRPMPKIPVGRSGMEAYVWKQTALAIQTFLLAAAADGLDTCPMEGFDERWVRKAVGLPPRFSVPAIVPVGYPARDVPRSPRFLPETVFFDNRYGSPKTDIKPL